MNTEELVQGSPEWLAIRCGKVTASRIADLTARTKTGWGASRANYMAELLTERLTKMPAPSFQNDAMRWGTEQEPAARAAYEWRHDCDVVQVGFVEHPTIGLCGASPDGFVGEVGMVEFKCPNSATHIDTLLGAEIEGKYIKQVQWQMACRPERQWCDWASFDPRLPSAMQFYVKRVPRDNAMIAALEKDAADFLNELAAKEAKLLEIYETRAAA